jgi:hypothetical protein
MKIKEKEKKKQSRKKIKNEKYVCEAGKKRGQ